MTGPIGDILWAAIAPASVLAVFAFLGKLYLDRLVGHQTERLKVSLSQAVAINQAKLVALQKTSDSVYTCWRAGRNLIEALSPQSDAALERATKHSVAEIAEKVSERATAMNEARLVLEKQFFSSKEYLPARLIKELDSFQQSVVVAHDTVLMIGTTSSSGPDFVANLQTNLESTESLARLLEANLVAERRDLLSPS